VDVGAVVQGDLKCVESVGRVVGQTQHPGVVLEQVRIKLVTELSQSGRSGATFPTYLYPQQSRPGR